VIRGSPGQNLCPIGWEGPTVTEECCRIRGQNVAETSAEQVFNSDGSKLACSKSQSEQDFIETNILPDGTDCVKKSRHKDASQTNRIPKARDPCTFKYTYPHQNQKTTPNNRNWWADHPVTDQVHCNVDRCKSPPAPDCTAFLSNSCPAGWKGLTTCVKVCCLAIQNEDTADDRQIGQDGGTDLGLIRSSEEGNFIQANPRSPTGTLQWQTVTWQN